MPAGRFKVKPKKQTLQPGNVTTDANRPQKRQPVTPQPPPGARGPVQESEVQHPQLQPRREPPVPILQQYGFNGTLNEFSHRLNMATVTHENVFGYKPTPGLAFDLARSKVPEDKFVDMLSVPKLNNKMLKASALAPPGAMGPAGNVNLEYDDRVYKNKLLTEAYKASKSGEKWPDFLDKHWKEVESLKKDDEDFAYRFQNVVKQGTHEGSMPTRVYSAALGGSSFFRAGFAPLNVGSKFVKQIYGSALLAPQAILWDIPKATALDGLDLRTSLRQSAHKKFPGLVHLTQKEEKAKGSYRPRRIQAMGESIKDDYIKRYSGYFSHPGRIADDPGFIFLDALGLATVFGGAVGRTAALRSISAERVAGLEVAAKYDNPAIIQWEQEFRPIVAKTKAAEKTGPVEPGISDLLNNKYDVYLKEATPPKVDREKQPPAVKQEKVTPKQLGPGDRVTLGKSFPNIKTVKEVKHLKKGISEIFFTDGTATRTDVSTKWTKHRNLQVERAAEETLASPKMVPEISKITGRPKPRWEKYSELRRYTPNEISQYHTYLNLIDQGERLGVEPSVIRDIISSVHRGETELHTQVANIPTRGDVLRAALKRPVSGVHEMRIGGDETYYPLSENYFVAQLQQYFPGIGLEAQRARADVRWAEDSPGSGEMLPVESLDGGAYDNAKRFFHKNFSYEAKFRRRKNAQGRYEEIIQMAPKRELESVIGRAIRTSETFANFPDRLRVRLSRAENKAIEVLSTDAWTLDEAYQSHVDFHKDMIDKGNGVPGAHERQLEDLKMARAVLDKYEQGKTRAVFNEAWRLTSEVAAEQEALKISELGLLPETAGARPVIHGMTLRGETFVPGKEEILKRMAADIEKYEAYRKGIVDAEGNPLPGHAEELKKIDKDIADSRQAIINVLVPPKRNPDAIYFKSERVARVKKKGYQRGQGRITVGEFGVALPASMQELNHWFLGNAMKAGDTRIDVPMLTAESYGKTIRHISVKNAYDNLWKAGRPANKPKVGYIPVRNVRNISPELRSLFSKIDQGTFDAKDAKRLEVDTQKILEELFPNPDDPRFKELLDREEIRWVDEAIVGDLGKTVPLEDTVLAPWMTIADTINDPFRFAFLYARPAYLLNYLSNAGMALFHQGLFSGPNMYKAYRAEHFYGAKAADQLRALVGEGRSKSYFAPESGLSKITGPAARGWSKVTDEHWRMSALIHELESRKFDIKKLNDFKSLTPEEVRTVTLSAEKSNQAMVQFDNLLPVEKQFLRHIIFVYPWQSRAAVWSLRTVLAHPIKTNVLVQLGNMVAETREDNYLKYAPQWFKDAGYMVFGFNKDGSPIVANPTTINTFATLSQEMNVIDSFFGPTQFSSGEDILGPTAKFAIHAFTGKDEFGNDYPGGNLWGAFKELLLTLPQLRAAKQKKQELAPVTGVDKTWGQMTPEQQAQWSTSQAGGAADIHILEKRERAALKQAVLSPMWQSTAANFFQSWGGGGLAPKIYDPQAAIPRFWQNQGWQKQFAHSVDLQRKALKMQSEIVGMPVPKKVKDAVEFSFVRTKAYREWHKKNGHEPGMQIKNEIDIKLFEDKGIINEKQASALRREANAVADGGDADTLRAKLNKLAGAEDYIDWDRNVRMVASFRNATIARDVSVLKELGLADSTPPHMSQDEYEEVGRKYLDWSIADKKKRDEIAATDDKYDKDVLSAKYRVWLQKQESIGEGLPSAPEFATARLAGAGSKLTQAMRSRMFESWGKIGDRDRTLLGKKTDPKMLEAWEKYYEAVDKYRKNNPPGKRGIEQIQRDLLAKTVDKVYPGFGDDYNFAKERLYKRFQDFNAFKDSKNKKRWREVFKAADAFSKAIDKNGSETYYKEAWKDAMIQYEAYYANEDPKWYAELQQIKKTKPTFLASLLSKGSVS